MRLLPFLAPLVLIAGCGGAQQSLHSGAGGLEGKVTRGPISPTCVKGKPCSGPARGITLSFSNGGKIVAHAKTGGDGGYRVELPAGRYSVRGVQPVRPQHVTVSGSGFRRVDFFIETRIR